MTTARIAPCKAARLGRWLPAVRDPARLAVHHPYLTASAKQRLETLSARPDTPGRPAGSRSRALLPVQSTIPTMPAAAKSP